VEKVFLEVSMSNPWSENSPANQSKKILVDLELARRILLARSEQRGVMPRGLAGFCDTLEEIRTGLHAAPNAWRKHRAFFIVDLPAIIAATEALGESVEETSERNDVLDLLERAFRKGDAVKSGIRSRLIEDSALALSVLDLPRQQPKSGVLSGVTRKLTSASSAVTARTGRLANQITMTGEGLYELAGLHLSESLQEMHSSIVRPISSRVSALYKGVLVAGSGAMVWGAVGALLFPPIAPFIVGEKLLSLPEEYTRQLARLSEEDARLDLERKGRTRLEIDRIMSGLKGKSLRIETPCLSLSIDTLNGKASGLILCGRHMGDALEDLDRETIVSLRDHAPDTETRQALEAWLARETE
jgi:hypothetical protein